jgi:hypothetical protein
MKYLFLVLVVITFKINIISAQKDSIDSRNKPYFGLKAGVNYSIGFDFREDNYYSNPKMGMAAGAFITIPILKYFGIQSEILYSQKGFRGTSKILGASYKFIRTANYIDAPLFFLLKPMKLLTLMAGPQYSYLMKQMDVFPNGKSNGGQEQVFKNNNIFKNTLCFICGIDINIFHLVLGARLGCDVTKNNGDGTTSIPAYKNFWCQGTLGYRFY